MAASLLGDVPGDAGINIAGIQVARDSIGGQALVALSVDTAIPADVLSDLQQAIDAASARALDLVRVERVSRFGAQLLVRALCSGREDRRRCH